MYLVALDEQKSSCSAFNQGNPAGYVVLTGMSVKVRFNCLCLFFR
jgi:hypothetical protein